MLAFVRTVAHSSNTYTQKSNWYIHFCMWYNWGYRSVPFKLPYRHKQRGQSSLKHFPYSISLFKTFFFHCTSAFIFTQVHYIIAFQTLNISQILHWRGIDPWSLSVYDLFYHCWYIQKLKFWTKTTQAYNKLNSIPLHNSKVQTVKVYFYMSSISDLDIYHINTLNTIPGDSCQSSYLNSHFKTKILIRSSFFCYKLRWPWL